MRVGLRLFVVAILVGPAQARGGGFPGILTAATLQTNCDHYVAGADNGKSTFDSPEQKQGYDFCLGFVGGVMNEMAAEIFWVDSQRTAVAVGQWDDVTPDQMIRVFLKYVKSNPESLNKPACIILRTAAENSGLYKETPKK